MCQNVVSHDVAQVASCSLRAKNKEPCLTSRVFYFLRSAFHGSPCCKPTTAVSFTRACKIGRRDWSPEYHTCDI
ncbi:TPA: hypothetical protein G8L72_003739 [Salmonella enterica]|uniref:Uncharacterized protein n=1 Tax=Salmonella enterica I TaxID=59201 RepID=A0A625QWR7_SALET|nr:hypothetical protein [Salmonella enterica]EBQ9027541.1 hypothetical protein [Salmonella enterica subsp. enterica serovar Ajiobo]EBZ6491170.1 hypothetical protein [Salmonella enterica subsp. enterica serovar Dugbe]ECE0829599.1 hypothetical protein [Salmonella enterica subsp. enterica serovar Bere]ECI0375340.1 hypothetical protein [Salmonella enterica subsp. enterica]EGI5505648.1 hypothetical protein [Salmonella enterica subsp. enterica serovar 47:z4,z23:-]